MRLSDKISGSLSSTFDKSILSALNESYEVWQKYYEDGRIITEFVQDFDSYEKAQRFADGLNRDPDCEAWVKDLEESEKKNLKEEDEDLPEVRWDSYDDYSEEEIEEINSYLARPNLVAIKHEGNKEQGYSVAVKDNNSGLIFWVDYQKDGQDISGEWNQYIFSTVSIRDRIKSAMQSAYTDDWSFFMDVDEVCMAYLLDHGLVSDSEEGMIFESSLNEDIKDDTASVAKQIALEIQERGIMGFDEIDSMAADILGITVEELRDQQLDTDIHISLNYEGIDNNMSTGDFYTQEYAEEHPEVLEESEKEECKECDNKENLKEETLNETDATPEFLEDLKNLINNHMRVSNIAQITLDNMEGEEYAVIAFESGGVKRINITANSNLAVARAILFELA